MALLIDIKQLFVQGPKWILRGGTRGLKIAEKGARDSHHPRARLGH